MDLLTEIVAVEQDIAKRLEAERAKAAAWLGQTKQEIAAATRADIERVTAAAAAEEALATEQALQRAAAIVRDAQALANRLAAVDDQQLRAIVLQHLAAIIPGSNCDRQDVEDRSDRPQRPAPAGAGDDSAIGDDAGRRRDPAAL